MLLRVLVPLVLLVLLVLERALEANADAAGAMLHTTRVQIEVAERGVGQKTGAHPHPASIRPPHVGNGDSDTFSTSSAAQPNGAVGVLELVAVLEAPPLVVYARRISLALAANFSEHAEVVQPVHEAAAFQ